MFGWSGGGGVTSLPLLSVLPFASVCLLSINRVLQLQRGPSPWSHPQRPGSPACVK